MAPLREKLNLFFLSPFTPGVLSQDVYVLPAEALVLGAMTLSASEFREPLFPFPKDSDVTTLRQPTRHSKTSLGIAAIVIGGGVFSALTYNTDGFPIGPYFRGLLHTHLINEIATSAAKIGFRRHRPHYEAEKSNGTLRQDDTYSFFSGHASHSFAFAAFTSEMLRAHSTPFIGWTYTAALFSGASWVGAIRAVDRQHYWSDVIVGGVVGTLIGSMVGHKVNGMFGPKVDADIGIGTSTQSSIPTVTFSVDF